MKIKIIYQDKDLLVVDKPANMVVFKEKEDQKDESLMNYLIKEYPELQKIGNFPRYGAIHRLDKETSGVLLIAKTNESLKYFQELFQKRKVKKEYWALCAGNFTEESGIIDTLIARSKAERIKQKAYSLYDFSARENGRRAITSFRVLKKFQNYTLIKAFPKTGRKHQIRCHMAHIGHPIVGDKLYSFKNQQFPEELNRHFLHAKKLKLIMPEGETKIFISKLPDSLKKILDKL